VTDRETDRQNCDGYDGLKHLAAFARNNNSLNTLVVNFEDYNLTEGIFIRPTYHFHSCPFFLKIVKAASNMRPITDAAMYHLEPAFTRYSSYIRKVSESRSLHNKSLYR